MTLVYPENFESKIKFDKIRDLIKKFCLSDMGRELVDKMKFSSNKTYIGEQLKETGEFMSILQLEDSFPSDHYTDARPFLQKIRVEGLFLDIPEMMALKISLESLSAIVRFFKDKEEMYPLLYSKTQDIQIFQIGRASCRERV